MSAVEGHLFPGRQGRKDGDPGLLVSLRNGVSLACVIPLSGQRSNCMQRLARVWNTSPDVLETRGRVEMGASEWIWSGPDRFMMIEPERSDGVLVLQTLLEDSAAVIDQSDGRFVLRLSGPAVRRTLAKGIGIDLHPAVFGADATALTQLCHLGVQLTRVGDGDVFDLIGPRAAADDLCDWLLASAAQYGIEIEV